MANDLALLLPELVLAIACLAGWAWSKTDESEAWAERLIWLASGLFIALAIIIAVRGTASGVFLNGIWVDDAFARFIKVLALMSAAVLLLISLRHLEAVGLLRADYPLGLGVCLLGGMLSASALDLWLIWVGLELSAFGLFLLSRPRLFAHAEAHPPNYRDAGIASALLLVALVLVAALGGTSSLAGLAGAMTGDDGEGPSLGLSLALSLFAVALLLKFAALPLSLWRPETSRHVPIPLAAILASLPKIVLVAVLVRLCFVALAPVEEVWRPVLAVFGLLALLVGGLTALVQSEMKGLLAHAGLAQMGFAIIAMALFSAAGLAAALIVVAVLIALQLGLYGFVLSMQSDGRPASALAGLAGFADRAPAQSLALLLILLGLVGVPPLLGFSSKIGVFLAAGEAAQATTWIVLAVIASLAFLPAAAAYARVLLMVYAKDEDPVLNGQTEPMPMLALFAAAALSLAGALGLFGLEAWANAAAASFAYP